MIAVPPSFRLMPRWWHDQAGRRWLDDLPMLVDAQCLRWGLEIDGVAMHGSNAIVVPVRRGSTPLALRLSPPGDDVAGEAGALRVWNGAGTVLLIDADADSRAMLLERLDGSHTLACEPLSTAIPVIAALTRRLAIPVPGGVRSTAEVAAEHAWSFAHDWSALDGPAPRTQLDRALELAQQRAHATVTSTAANGDLHYGQVLTGTREPWLVVDPVLLRGDPEYDLGRVLWSRLDEMPDDADIVAAFESFVHHAQVPADRAAGWVVIRSMSYLLWGLSRGLTEDPPRCRRLLDLFCGH